MEANKENMRIRSKIPVPLEKSARFITNNDVTKLTSRNPLKTINGLCTNQEAGPSQAKRLDVRHVTHRTCDEKLDWKFEVFKDQIKLRPVLKSKDVLNVENDVENSSGPVTPFSQSPPPLKKVKRSLKRARLNCSSPAGVPKKIPENQELIATDLLFLHTYASDNLRHLQRIEKKEVGVPKIRKISRSCVVNWIINVNETSGNPAIVELACWYLDSYLTRTWVPLERLQLIAAACYWIAAKFHGVAVTSLRLVRWSGYAFTVDKLVASETSVLQKLKFPPIPPVPLDFVPYLSWWSDIEDPGPVEAAATFLCLAALQVDKALRGEYVSVTATAAVKSALILLGRDDLVPKLEACPIYISAEKKAGSLPATCARLHDAVRIMASPRYEYKAAIRRCTAAPHFIAPLIIEGVHFEEILAHDDCFRRHVVIGD